MSRHVETYHLVNLMRNDGADNVSENTIGAIHSITYREVVRESFRTPQSLSAGTSRLSSHLMVHSGVGPPGIFAYLKNYWLQMRPWCGYVVRHTSVAAYMSTPPSLPWSQSWDGLCCQCGSPRFGLVQYLTIALEDRLAQHRISIFDES